MHKTSIHHIQLYTCINIETQELNSENVKEKECTVVRQRNINAMHCLSKADVIYVISTCKAYIPPERKIPCVGGWRWAMPPTPDFCVGNTNMLVSKM